MNDKAKLSRDQTRSVSTVSAAAGKAEPWGLLALSRAADWLARTVHTLQNHEGESATPCSWLDQAPLPPRGCRDLCRLCHPNSLPVTSSPLPVVPCPSLNCPLCLPLPGSKMPQQTRRPNSVSPTSSSSFRWFMSAPRMHAPTVRPSGLPASPRHKHPICALLRVTSRSVLAFRVHPRLSIPSPSS